MKSFFLPIALLASSVAAQTSACGADYIVEACLSSQTDILNKCGAQDYNCRCAAWEAIITCYNNCPNDTRKFESQGQKEIFCGYASQFPSSTTKVAAARQSQAQVQHTSNSNAAGNEATGTADSTASSTSTSTPATNTNSAAYLALNAGGVLAAVAGVVAVVL
ncbi:hypothetical protein QBC35DRAFT_36600 [Podospora australis]|uniref:GPI anchored serine-threonine rich protein n=1 Tax=Podospora australis TaxID=1536484 RepID=A0AAN6WZN0_9PEZI|nr:hypothetical protein QBC35DRAFT_36600 [Podospora australis]